MFDDFDFTSISFTSWNSTNNCQQFFIMPFRSKSEHDIWLAETRERNAQLQRDQMKQYAKSFILPRIDFGNESTLSSSSRILPRLKPLSTSSTAARGLSPFNRHLVTGGLIFSPLILFAVIFLRHDRQDKKTPLPPT